MQPVEVLTIQESLILRAAGSELLILPNHVAELKKLQQPRDFTSYFMGETLVNRSARKLFEAWLRKDQGLWQRIFKTVQTIDVTDETLKAIADAQSPVKTTVSEPAKKTPAAKTKSDVTPKAAAPKAKKDDDKPAAKKTAAPKSSGAKKPAKTSSAKSSPKKKSK